MSNYEWESGKIVIPRAEWAGFKRTIREAYNALQAKRLRTAEKAHEMLLAKSKGKRGVDFHALYEEVFQEISNGGGHSSSRNRYYGMPGGYPPYNPYATEEGDSDKIFEALFPYLPADEKGRVGPRRPKPVTPKKSSFPLANGSTNKMYTGDAVIGFDDKEHAVAWVVGEGNHSVERSHETELAGVLFKALSKVKWARNSGGVIVGNNEYNSESRDEGGGANFTSHRFGPLGASRFEIARRRSR